VAVELTNILCLLPAILTLNIDIRDTDPKGIVENENGVSPSDLKVVVVEMKVRNLREDDDDVYSDRLHLI
jgi:hypothetical protein